MIEVAIDVPLAGRPLVVLGGRFVVTCGSERLLVDPTSGSIERRAGHVAWVNALATDGEQLASIDERGGLLVWTPATGDERAWQFDGALAPDVALRAGVAYVSTRATVQAWGPGDEAPRSIVRSEGGTIEADEAGLLVLRSECDLRRVDPTTGRARVLIKRGHRPLAAGWLAGGGAWGGWSQGGGRVALFAPRSTVATELDVGNALAAWSTSADRRRLVVASPSNGASTVDPAAATVTRLGLAGSALCVANDGRVAAASGSVLAWVDPAGSKAGEHDFGERVHRLACTDDAIAVAFGRGWTPDRLAVVPW